MEKRTAMEMELAHPVWLWLMLLVPLPAVLEWFRPRVSWPTLDGLVPRRRLAPRGARWFPPLLRGLAFAALAVALARPRTVGGTTYVRARGVAIVALLDHSSSMRAMDFPSERGTRAIARLTAAQSTFLRFVEGRPDDLIGLVAFANYPDLACPPTLDHRFLAEAVAAVRPARPGDDGTNIGDAIVVGLDAVLRASPKKKALVLLTDGNNEPAVPRPAAPLAAAELARDWGVVLHTIAIGRSSGVLHGADRATGQPTMSEVSGPNLEMLEQIAEATGGRDFVATDADALASVFREIDELEKSPVHGRVLTRYDEHFGRWALLAFFLLVVDRLLAQGPLRRLP